jgi:uncharacterized protein YecE (DUF72 family)
MPQIAHVEFFIGTSGFSYPEWRGSFYPEKFATSKMLAFYAQRMRTVELNNTFYRMPKEDVLRGWAETTPPPFRFAPKASQQITHRQKLAGSADSAAYLFRTLGALGDKLGPVLFQLPPTFRKDLSRLTDFLALVPAGMKVAFEFRHASWFDDAVYGALASAQAALCIADAEDLTTPVVATTDWGYLRLRRMDYDEAALTVWAERVQAKARPGEASGGTPAAWHSAFVYFKHEDAGRGPQLADQMGRLLGLASSSVS